MTNTLALSSGLSHFSRDSVNPSPKKSVRHDEHFHGRRLQVSHAAFEIATSASARERLDKQGAVTPKSVLGNHPAHGDPGRAWALGKRKPAVWR